MGTLILKRPVVGITGSAGKTTTKEMIAAVLQTRWQVFKNRSNNNIIRSTRSHAKKIKPSHQAVVLEFGMAAPGLIKQHCQIIQPNIGVITNVGSAHIGHFGGKVERLAAAKSELIRYMKRDGLLVINADDPNSKLLATDGFQGHIMRVGITEEADYRARHIEYAFREMRFEAQVKGTWHRFSIPLLGRHNVYNALFAIAVADQLGFSVQEIAEGLRRTLRTGRRVYPHSLGNGITLIDDSYSANPHAVKAGLDVLLNVGQGIKVVVLGDMLELGVYTTRGHRQVGKYIAEQGIDYLLTLGKRAQASGRSAIASGMPADRVKHFTSRQDLHQFLKKLLQEPATILVKGSHETEMTQTADFLRYHFTGYRPRKSRKNSDQKLHKTKPANRSGKQAGTPANGIKARPARI